MAKRPLSADGEIFDVDREVIWASTPIKDMMDLGVEQGALSEDDEPGLLNPCCQQLLKEIKILQYEMSKLALENEQLKYDLNQSKLDLDGLSAEMAKKEAIQAKMGQKLEIVTNTIYTICEKFRAFKCRYYEEQLRQNNAWLGFSEDK